MAAAGGPRFEQDVSEPEPVSAKIQYDAPLEELPTELRLHILTMMELAQLDALVHASPTFHRDYRRNRRFVLFECLQLTLGEVMVDAIAVFQSSSDEPARAWTGDKITQFMHSHRDRGAWIQNPHLSQPLAEEEVVSMASFYSSIVNPLAPRYIDWALTNISEEMGSSRYHMELSKVETTRLVRALYRFQLCCQLFGRGRLETTEPIRLRPERQRPLNILKLFFSLFEPWEAEEVVCIYVWAKEILDQIFKDIYWDVHPENPKFDDQRRPPTPDGAFDLDIGNSRDGLLQGTISRGLDLLHTVLARVSDHAQLVLTMQTELGISVGFFLEGDALGETAQSMLREKYLSPREQKQQRRDPLPFIGDGDSNTDGPRPPLAWTLMWGGTYSNLFGYYVSDDIRRLGYVIWDAERLEQTGAKEAVLRKWADDWDDDDPRDSLM